MEDQLVKGIFIQVGFLADESPFDSFGTNPGGIQSFPVIPDFNDDVVPALRRGKQDGSLGCLATADPFLRSFYPMIRGISNHMN